MPKRMNREEFFAKLSPLDEDRLRKVLWNLYWRGWAPPPRARELADQRSRWEATGSTELGLD